MVSLRGRESDGRIVGRIVSDEEGSSARPSIGGLDDEEVEEERPGKSYLKVVLIDVGGTRVKRHT